MKKQFNWRKYLTENLESTQFLALSTIGKEGSWTCPVFFAYDSNFNLYFISQPKSKHISYISSNNSISAAIFSTNQNPAEDVYGMQLKGKAVILPDKEVEEAFKIYYKRSPLGVVMKDNHPNNYKGPSAEWKFVKIIPEEIYYFDTRFFDEERQTVPKEVYR